MRIQLSDSEPLLEPIFHLPVGSDAAENMPGVNSDDSHAHDADTPTRSIVHHYLPISASILVHLCLLILLRQMMTGTALETNNFVAPPASIQFTFRSRPVPPTVTETEPEQSLQDAVAEQVPAEQATPQIIAEPAMAESSAEELPVPAENLPDATVPDLTPPQAPRLVAPALADLREVIRNQAKSDDISRGYNNLECDERQRRNDLIDCGDNDSTTFGDLADAQQNPTAAFFADLSAPASSHNSQPRDATNPDTRANVARDNLTGNLGAGPLIRSVMGQP
jgi:hypothetical protein